MNKNISPKNYIKPETHEVKLPEDFAACTVDSMINTSQGNVTIGWTSNQTTLFLVIKGNEQDEPGAHYYFNPNPQYAYRFTNGNGEWATCNWEYTDGSNPCEYNVVGDCKVQVSTNGGKTWNEVTLTPWSGGESEKPGGKP